MPAAAAAQAAASCVLSANGGEGGVTLQANGGSGGNAWQIQPYSLGNRHGPGGGGGGGVVFVSGAPASVSVAGGTNGLTLNPGVPYGATPGHCRHQRYQRVDLFHLRNSVGSAMHSRRHFG